MGLIKKISDRLKECDKIQEENLKIIRGLASESRRKTDYLSEQVIKAEKKLKEDPGNPALGGQQREYAALVTTRQMFVAGKNLERNVLIAVQGKQHPLLFSHWLTASDLFWINDEAPQLPFRCKAKVRYRQSDQDCTIEPADQGNGYKIVFDEPQRAVTPGQSVVIYDQNNCLGGGIIETTGKTTETLTEQA